MSPQPNLDHLNQIQPHHKHSIYYQYMEMKFYGHPTRSYIFDDDALVEVVGITMDQICHWLGKYLDHTGESPLWI